MPPSGRTDKRIQVAATLRKDGKLDGITLLTKASAAVQRAVLQDATSWEFQPVTSTVFPWMLTWSWNSPSSLPTSIAKTRNHRAVYLPFTGILTYTVSTHRVQFHISDMKLRLWISCGKVEKHISSEMFSEITPGRNDRGRSKRPGKCQVRTGNHPSGIVPAVPSHIQVILLDGGIAESNEVSLAIETPSEGKRLENRLELLSERR